jgi:hypothetical protein
LRVLMLSGYSRHHQLPASIQFLQKPFTAETLLAKVREVLDAEMPRSAADVSRCSEDLG